MRQSLKCEAGFFFVVFCFLHSTYSIYHTSERSLTHTRTWMGLSKRLESIHVTCSFSACMLKRWNVDTNIMGLMWILFAHFSILRRGQPSRVCAVCRMCIKFCISFAEWAHSIKYVNFECIWCQIFTMYAGTQLSHSSILSRSYLTAAKTVRPQT